jgi:hypothetical protein
MIALLLAFLVGVLVNLLTTPTGFNWGGIFNSWMAYVALVLIGLATWYQVKVSEFDKAEKNVLERAKEGLTANIGEFYAEKIKAGNISELVKADEAMKQIFQNEKKK